MKQIKILLVLLATSLAPALANAVLVEMTFEGSVYDSRDDFDLFGLGNGDDTIVGATATAVYTFDTDDIPTTDADSSFPTITDYRDGTSWLAATTSIDTSAIDLSVSGDEVPDADQSYDRLYIRDDGAAGGSLEHIWLQSYDAGGSPFESVLQRVDFHGSGLNKLSSFDPGDALNLMDPSLWPNALGMVQYYSAAQYTHARFRIQSASLSYVSVPEPGSLALLGAGLFALGIARRRRA